MSNVISIVEATTTDQSVLRSLDSAPVIHFTVARRHGAFAATVADNDWVDLDHLAKQLQWAESRFNLTKREVKGNKLVRKAKSGGVGGKEGTGLMGDIASNGAWYVLIPSYKAYLSLADKLFSCYRYANVGIGQPAQDIEMDLNMLASDFYVVKTSSQTGKSYDDFFSSSISKA